MMDVQNLIVIEIKYETKQNFRIILPQFFQIQKSHVPWRKKFLLSSFEIAAGLATDLNYFDYYRKFIGINYFLGN